MARRRFIEIAANLTDPMFQGSYHGTVKHQPDLDRVLGRCWDAGVDKVIVTGTTLGDSREALGMAERDERLYSTAGCHPTHAGDFDKGGNPEKYLEDLEELICANRGKIVALGECGLDFDRLHFCDKPTQLKYFEKQLALAEKLQIPMFLHCRAASEDFWPLIEKYRPSGVVHSFDGTSDFARQLVLSGLGIGVNGCSLKTPENLAVVKDIPLESLHLETDAPWCDVRPSHAGFRHVKTKYESVKKEKWRPDAMVKSRNEPANIVQILEIVAAIKGVDEDELSVQIYSNSMKTFFGHL